MVRIKDKRVYEAYSKHCKIHGEHAIAYQSFSRRLLNGWDITTAILTWNVKGSQTAKTKSPKEIIIQEKEIHPMPVKVIKKKVTPHVRIGEIMHRQEKFENNTKAVLIAMWFILLAIIVWIALS